MKIACDDYKSMLLINCKLTKTIFLEKAGVKDGYSLHVFSKMYDSIFSELIDVEREFEKYYSFEYKSLEQFLWKKYNLNSKQINELMEEREKNPNCRLYKKDEFSYGDDGLMQFTFSDTMLERLMDILMLKI